MKKTKDQSRQVATKGDVKKLELATRRDLKKLELSTKKDIKSLELSTKKDMKSLELSTKKDMENFERKLGGKIDGLETKFDGLEIRFDGLETRFDGVEKNMHTLMSLYVTMDSRVKNLEENMYTKKDHEKFMILIDEAIWEMRAAQESRILNEKHILLMDDQIDNHEKRLVVLERK